MTEGRAGARRGPRARPVPPLGRCARLAAAARPNASLPSTSVPNDHTLTDSTSQSRLPIAPTPLIGRERELASLEKLLLRRDLRLLSLVGPGGVGKTRLALELATRVQDAFSDGVHVVPLTPIREPDLVVSAIAQVLGIPEQPGQPLLDVVKEQLRRLHLLLLLLLLDNFEHLLPAAPLVAELLAASLGLKVLVSSRAALRLRGEREFLVPPLGLPELSRAVSLGADDLGDGATALLARDTRQTPASRQARPTGDMVAPIGADPSVRLFVERAQAVRPDFALSAGNASAVGQVCSRLDGLPLAIELAAARARVLSPEALLPRLEHRLAILTGGASDLPVRQRTLRATLAWSYDLLSERDRLAFRRLAVFVGGCSLDAAQALIAAELSKSDAVDTTSASAETEDAVDDLDDLDALDRLDSLVGKSLLQRGDKAGDQRDGEPRFGMLETIREFGLEELTASGEEEAVRAWHARYFAALAGQVADFYTSEHAVRIRRLDAELGTVRSALAWCLEHDPELGLALAESLQVFWGTRGYRDEGERWLRCLLAINPAARLPRARALVAYGELLGSISPLKKEAWTEALAIYRAKGDARGIARALVDLAFLQVMWEEYDPPSCPMLEEAISLVREIGAADDLADGLNFLAKLELDRRNFDRARRLCEEALDLRRRKSSPWRVIDSLSWMGNVERARGDLDRARELYEEGLALARAIWGTVSPRGGVFLGDLGELAQLQGDFSRARPLLHEAIGIMARVSHRYQPPEYLLNLGIVEIEEGSAERGTRLVSAAESLLSGRSHGGAMGADVCANRDRCLTAARSTLGEEAFARAYAEGQAMTLQEAVEYALQI